MEEWGTNFNHIIYSEKNKSSPPSDEDIDYILDKFIDAVEERGLICGGGCSPVRIDKVFVRYVIKTKQT